MYYIAHTWGTGQLLGGLGGLAKIVDTIFNAHFNFQKIFFLIIS
jgi:hypothetical protein